MESVCKSSSKRAGAQVPQLRRVRHNRSLSSPAQLYRHTARHKKNAKSSTGQYSTSALHCHEHRQHFLTPQPIKALSSNVHLHLQRPQSRCQCLPEPHSRYRNGLPPQSSKLDQEEDPEDAVEQHGKVERLRLADGIPMVAWYTKPSSGNWKSQITESKSTMQLITLLSIVMLVNMTGLVFSLFIALFSADVVHTIKHHDSSGTLFLLVNFLFFGLGPSTLVRIYKSVVRVLLAPVRSKYKERLNRISKVGAGDLEKGVGEIIHVLSFEKIEAGTEDDIEGGEDVPGVADIDDIDVDGFNT